MDMAKEIQNVAKQLNEELYAAEESNDADAIAEAKDNMVNFVVDLAVELKEDAALRIYAAEQTRAARVHGIVTG